MPTATVKFEIDHSTPEVKRDPHKIRTTISFGFGESIEDKLKAAFDANLRLLYGSEPTIRMDFGDALDHLGETVEDEPFFNASNTITPKSTADTLKGVHEYAQRLLGEGE